VSVSFAARCSSAGGGGHVETAARRATTSPLEGTGDLGGDHCDHLVKQTAARAATMMDAALKPAAKA
jgi:hypothetical protein